MPQIILKNISYSTKTINILSNITLNIAPSTFTGIMGMNGSGKTTLLKLLCSAIKPTQGKIFLDKKNIKDYSVRELAHQVGVVFQNDDIQLDFSALQIVLMSRMSYQRLFSKDSPNDLIIAEDCMKKTNTLQLKDRLFTTLSGGERQRVLIARALCQQTPVILLDEPIASLDLKHQQDIINLLKTIQNNEKRTIIMVIHDLSLALQYCDNIIALKDGKMFMYDTAYKVLTPKNIKNIFCINTKIINNKHIIIQNNENI